jgi:excisionase family DNA binding protein
MPKRQRHSPPHLEPLAVRTAEAERLLSVGHSKLYELINAGELDCYKDGSSTKITMASIKRRVAARLAAGYRKGRYPRRATT